MSGSQTVRRSGGHWRRLRHAIRQPRDLIYALRLGVFIARLPRRVATHSLPALLESMHGQRVLPARNVDEGVERLARLGAVWTGLPVFRGHQNCYVRAMYTFRFLAVNGASKRIHFLVEPGESPGAHPKGHAWVTVDGRILDTEVAHLAQRCREIYSFPPSSAPGNKAVSVYD